MKALAIDSATSKLTIAAKNEERSVSVIFDIGMKQSETILPAIDYVLSKVDLCAKELDYTTVTAGPGSFTGLRLAYSALKAIELAYKIPIYAISTLDVYSYEYRKFPFTTVCAIDAKKDRFYSAAYNQDTKILEDGDFTPEQLIEKLDETDLTQTILICGYDAQLLESKIKDSFPNKKIIALPFYTDISKSLFECAENKISHGEAPMKDFEGPIYLRASEAEVKLNS